MPPTTTATGIATHPPPQSALSSLISSHHTTATAAAAETPHLALALTVLHNLQYQHSWTALSLHAITAGGQQQQQLISIPTTAATTTSTIDTYLISGLPPKHSYIHPSLQNHLVRRGIDESRLVVQREWVLPVGTARSGSSSSSDGSSGKSLQKGSSSSSSSSWTLRRFCGVFDALPVREVVRLYSNHGGDKEEEEGEGEGEEEIEIKWRDAKRVVMGMLAANGKGGDGTIVYYIMHEGEVKPRPNG